MKVLVHKLRLHFFKIKIVILSQLWSLFQLKKKNSADSVCSFSYRKLLFGTSLEPIL